MAWTADHIPDQRHRVFLITGANSGIGFETAKALADHDATVIMACRREGRAEDACERIREAVQGARLRIEQCDLASLSSIEACAHRLRKDAIAIDGLINNAGVMGVPYQETADGFEAQFGINHLGHFALTAHLLPILAPNSRIVTVSSEMHRRGSLAFDDVQLKHSYRRWQAYANSKLANILFSYELDRRLEKTNKPVKSVAAHPGYADTALQQRSAGDSKIRQFCMSMANSIFAQSAARGALPILFAATYPSITRRSYFGPDGLFNMRGYPTESEPALAARDVQTARNLWEHSRELTDISPPLEQSL